jgi:putative ABC transport system ATP-binding protein
VSLRVPRGSFSAVVGDSGSGKSTLLNQADLLDTPTSGCVILFGIHTGRLSLRGRTRLRGRRIGLVFQDYKLLPTMTVKRNVLQPLLVAGEDERALEARFAAAMSRVGLPPDYGGRLPAQLSGGEAQRAAVARALITEPELVVADEPTANLDPENKIRVLQMLADVCAPPRSGSVLLVTHNRELAFEFADRIFVLEAGRLAAWESRGPRGFSPEFRARVGQAFRLRRSPS